jgi:hypothetical protein
MFDSELSQIEQPQIIPRMAKDDRYRTSGSVEKNRSEFIKSAFVIHIADRCVESDIISRLERRWAITGRQQFKFITLSCFGKSRCGSKSFSFRHVTIGDLSFAALGINLLER